MPQHLPLQKYYFMTLRHLLLMLPALAFTTANAQLTSAIVPVDGDSINYSGSLATTAVPQGAAGTAQTWNFSTLQLGGNISFVFSAGTQGAVGAACAGTNLAEVDYENGNIALGNNYNSTTNSLEVLCSYSLADGAQYNYTDGLTMFNFPLAYGDSVYDTYSGTINIDTDVLDFNGYAWYKVDGSGTLILPDGTHNNVLRMHRRILNTIYFLGDVLQTVTSDNYEWFNADNKFHILQLKTQIVDVPILQQLDTTHIYTFQSTAPETIGISESLVSGRITVYPNPASNQATLAINLKKQADIAYNVIDATGRTVRSFNQANVNSGNQYFAIDLAGVSSGLYMVQYTVNGQSGYSKLFVR